MKPFGVIVDRTASWLHGVDSFEFHELEHLPPLEVFVLSERSRVRRTGMTGGERELIPTDVMILYGVRVTTPLRTALDLGCRLGRRDGLACLDGFMRVHGLDRTALTRELPRFRRRRGVVQLRRLVTIADGRAESPGESWTRMVMLEVGLPAPEPQVWVRENGRDKFRLDLAYPDQRVCVEYDGQAFHTSPEQQAADRRRRLWLRSHGWTVIVVTKDDFDSLAIDVWTRQVFDALRIAA